MILILFICFLKRVIEGYKLYWEDEIILNENKGFYIINILRYGVRVFIWI